MDDTGACVAGVIPITLIRKDLSRPNWSGCMADAIRTVLLGALARQRGGRVTVIEGEREQTYGAGGDLACTVEVRDERVWRDVLRGSTGVGEAYMDDVLRPVTPADLVTFLRILIRAIARPSAVLDRLSRLASPVMTPIRRMRRRTPDDDARDVRAHYDLGDDFFRLFLDDTMTYSCAIFDDPSWTLEQAQSEKIDRLCRKLELREGERLVEIGTGWGSMAVHAATNYGVHVTTTTLSDNQYAYAQRRVEALGLTDLVDVRHEDYRDLRGPYDKLVSVEMIEAVDWRQHGDFFGACSDLLAPHGAMALQAIVHRDQHYARAMNTNHWLKRYIFPGGLMPSIGAITKAVAAKTDLAITALEDIGLHYAKTLASWRERFRDRLDEVRAQGYDERFIRTWDFYLASCEASFTERYVSDIQMVLTKPAWRPGIAETVPA